MLKRLFYSSAIILMLAIAFHLGNRDAQAQSPMQVRWVGGGSGGDDPFFATSSGVYQFADNGWRTLAEGGYLEPPIPVDAVLYYTAQKVVSTSGEAFYRLGGQWVSRGIIPGSAISVLPETWTGVKNKYRK